MDAVVIGAFLTLLALTSLWMVVDVRKRAANSRRDAPETRFGLHTDGMERRRSDATKLLVEWHRHGDWLRMLWASELREFANGNCPDDQAWRMERVTVTMPVELPDGTGGSFTPASRGQVHDLSGLLEPASQTQQDMLEFFGLNARVARTVAERELRRIMQSDESVRAWYHRPVTSLQRLFFRHTGLGLHPSLTAEAAQPLMDEYLDECSDDDLIADWVSLESIFRDLTNPTIAAQYGLAPPPPHQLLQVFKALRREGFTAHELYMQLNLVTQRLVANQSKQAAQKGNNPVYKKSSRGRV